MLRPRALWLLLAVLTACDAPPRATAPAAPQAGEKPAAIPPSGEQAEKLAAQCEKLAREQSRREGKGGAEIASHYNVKLKTCFFLLAETSAGTLKKILVDANGGERYGEFIGPARSESPAAEQPKTCRVESFYCASGREWDVLAEPYMQE